MGYRAKMTRPQRDHPCQPSLMANPIASAWTFWCRRWWREDKEALARFVGQTPAVVITGASAGIGLAMAHRYAAEGRDLVLIARDPGRLEAAVKAVRRLSGHRVMPLVLDVTAPDVTAQLDAALGALGAYPDILVNNAGVGLAGHFTGQSPDALVRLTALNVTALTMLCRHVLPGQLVRGRGGIINMASLGGYFPGPEQAAYFASKAYVISLSEALAAEVAGKGVTITVVAAGPVDTEFHAKMGTADAWYRLLMPSLSAEHVATAAIRGFQRGQRLVVPGAFNKLGMLALRLLPHVIVVPVAAILLRPTRRPV